MDPTKPTETNLPDDISEDTSDVDQIFAVLSDKPEPSPAPAPVEGSSDAAAPAPPAQAPSTATQPVPEAPAAQAPAQAPVAPAQAPAPAEKPVTQEAAPAAQGATPLPATVSPEAAQPAAPAPSEAELRAELEKTEKGLQEYYKLRDEDARAFQTEPENVLPSLAAKLHMAVQASVYQQITAILPHIIQQQTDTRLRESEAKNAFFGRWPQLREHEASVRAAGQIYRAMNPKADHTTAIERIGEMVCAGLGIPANGAAAPQAGAPAAAAAAVARPAAFRPAGAVGTPAPAPVANPNIFSTIAEEDIAVGDR